MASEAPPTVQTLQQNVEKIGLTCVMCNNYFKVLVGSLDIVSITDQTGYCPHCKMLCRYCEKKPFDSSSDVLLCIDCHNERERLQTEDSSNDDDIDDDFDDEIIELTCMEDIEGVENDEDVVTTSNVAQTIDTNEELHDQPNSDHDEENNSLVISKQLSAIYTASFGQMGTDGAGGSTNGEPTPESCKIIAHGLELNANDCLCDIGSGGGLTLMQMTAELKTKCSIGIEAEVIRHQLSDNFLLAFMNTCPDLDFPVSFINADICAFNDLNGFTKIYMYDAVFPANVMTKISQIFNQTRSIQYIASTKDLKDYNFNVELHRNLGCLPARGNHMSHTFYVYKCMHYSSSSPLISMSDKRLTDAFSIATSKEKRYNSALSHINAIHKSEPSMRDIHVRRVLGESKPQNNSQKSSELFDLLAKNKSTQARNINGITYNVTSNTKTFVRFNEAKLLLKEHKTEMAAIVNKRESKALIAPCYDGNTNGDGKILLVLQYDSTANVQNTAITYDIFNDKLQFKVPLTDLWNRFDYTSSIPIDIHDLLKNYRKDCPLAPIFSPLVTPRKLGNNHAEDELEKYHSVLRNRTKPPPAHRSTTRSSNGSKRKNEEDSNESLSSKKLKSTKANNIIDAKLKRKYDEQQAIINDLHAKIAKQNDENKILQKQNEKAGQIDQKVIDKIVDKCATTFAAKLNDNNESLLELKCNELHVAYQNLALCQQKIELQEQYSQEKFNLMLEQRERDDKFRADEKAESKAQELKADVDRKAQQDREDKKDSEQWTRMKESNELLVNSFKEMIVALAKR